MKKTEGPIKQALMKTLRTVPALLSERIEDTRTSGIPDIVTSGLGHTLWIEVKGADTEVTVLQAQKLQHRYAATRGRAVLLRVKIDRTNWIGIFYRVISAKEPIQMQAIGIVTGKKDAFMRKFLSWVQRRLHHGFEFQTLEGEIDGR